MVPPPYNIKAYLTPILLGLSDHCFGHCQIVFAAFFIVFHPYLMWSQGEEMKEECNWYWLGMLASFFLR